MVLKSILTASPLQNRLIWEVTDKGKTGLDACRYLIDDDISCPKIIIHSIHPYADRMGKLLQENMRHSVIAMEEYDMQKVMKGYEV